jgi:hypothetical protein
MEDHAAAAVISDTEKMRGAVPDAVMGMLSFQIYS